MGYICPKFVDIADFLQELPTAEGYVHVCIYIYTLKYVHIYIGHTLIYMDTYMNMEIRCTYMYIYIYMYVYIYIYTYT
jgi:hypothetical protein